MRIDVISVIFISVVVFSVIPLAASEFRVDIYEVKL